MFKTTKSQVVVAHIFNPSTQQDLCEFQGSLVYRANSRTAMAAQRNPILRLGGGVRGWEAVPRKVLLTPWFSSQNLMEMPGHREYSMLSLHGWLCQEHLGWVK